MRLSNRRKTPLYNFFLAVINLVLFGGVLVFLLEIFKLNLLGNEKYLLLIIPMLLYLIFILRGRQIFEYDSDGEAINLKNRNIITFLGNNISDEFPKYKVVNFIIRNFIFYKKLYLTISSKKKNFITLTYDISYLTKKELNDLKLSLHKVIKINRDQAKSEITQ